MRLHDISVPLQPNMPTYDGEAGLKLEFTKLLSRGDSANVSVLSFGSHTDTHVDAPSHFIDGANSMERLPLEALVGPAYVAEFSGNTHITATDLESMAIPADCERLLFKTPNGRFWDEPTFHREFIALAPDAARELAERGMRLVGIDYLSIERFRASPHEVHETLLASGMVILEGLDLRRVTPGGYFWCAHLSTSLVQRVPQPVPFSSTRPRSEARRL